MYIYKLIDLSDSTPKDFFPVTDSETATWVLLNLDLPNLPLGTGKTSQFTHILIELSLWLRNPSPCLLKITLLVSC